MPHTDSRDPRLRRNVALLCGLRATQMALFPMAILSGLQHPALSHREQRLVPSRDRAGFVSLRSMVFRLGFVVVGPAVGWAVDHHGQHPVMLVLALGFGVAGLLAAWALGRAPGPPGGLSEPAGPVRASPHARPELVGGPHSASG